MKPLTLKQNIQPEPEPPKVSIDMAEQIANRAARIAANDVSRENMESFNRFQEQNKQQNKQVPFEKDSIYEEPDGGYSIDTKTEKNLMRRLLDQTLQKALEPPQPSPIENAVNTVMNTVSAGIAEKMLGNIGGGGTSITNKPSFLMDVLNTAAAHGFGESLGNNLPQVIQSLSGAIGQKKTQELVDNINSKMSSGGGGNNGGNVEQDNSSNAEKQKDMVLALDSNNIDHIKQYSSAMGLSEKAAKGMLQIHQDDILTERKSQSTNLNSSNNGSNNNEITQALTILIQEMTGMKQTINALQNKMGGIENKDIDDDRETSTEGIQQKSVTLFQSPIKVDLDQIKGNADPFFNETKSNLNDNIKANSINRKELEKESVLEEMVDSAGKSSFKMSDEKEQPKIEKNITEKKIEKSIEKPIEKEEDKKKESDSVELIDENIDTINIIESEKINENIEEIPKIEHKIIRKKIIRKPVLIEEIQETQESLIKQEHYDINNNLIPEDIT